MSENRKLLVQVGGWSAAMAGLIDIVAGFVHGFGKDDETQYGQLHLAVGHGLNVLALALLTVWLAAVMVLVVERLRWWGAVAFAVAEVGLVLRAADNAVHSLGFYAFATVNVPITVHVATHAPGLAKGFFLASVIPLLLGFAVLLGPAVKARAVPLAAAVLLFVGLVPSEFAAPPGEWLLGVGALWAAWGMLRSITTQAVVTPVPAS